MKPKSKRSALVLSVLWSVVTALWFLTMLIRMSVPATDELTFALTGLTLLASAACTVVHWLRYFKFSSEEG